MLDTLSLKSYMFLLMTSLLFGCQETNKPSASDTISEINMHPNKLRKPATMCRIDTVAILTNARLDYLLQEASIEKLQVFAKVDSIPTHILSFLDCLAGGSFSIADPTAAWNNSCDFDDRLPKRQLAYVGVGNNITLLTYYIGGIGVRKRAIIIKSANGQIQDYWHGPLAYEAETTDQIIASITDLQHEAASVKRIYFMKRHVLNKLDTTLSFYEKVLLISTELSI